MYILITSSGLQSARTKYPDQVVGIGTTPEGIDQNHINFEFLYEMSWRGMEKIDRFEWMSQYIKRRYQDTDGVTLGMNGVFQFIKAVFILF